MSAFHIESIPYRADSRCYFRQLRDLPHPAWLDSGRPMAKFGRYDILTAAPRHHVQARQGSVWLDGQPRQEEPFQLLRQLLAELPHVDDPQLPFCGGALGYVGYHLGAPATPPRDIAIPDLVVGIYEWALIQDHQDGRSYLLRLNSGAVTRDWRELRRRFQNAPRKESENSFCIRDLESNFNFETYLDRVSAIQDYIRAGDCYQVNFAQRFSGRFEGDAFQAYCHLRELLPAPYGGYLETGQRALLSHSPEQFLALHQRQVQTRPIKGTAPRHGSPNRDRTLAEALQRSEKDRAENVMIVDLLRNDLGKNCRAGSIRVPALCRLESYANVHHLVSTVCGELLPDRDGLDLLRDSFPGGSITGAPKRRAMEIITELEHTDRAAYCGSLAYLSVNGNMDSNILIRSLVQAGQQIYCWGGGGIVADSEPEAEYRESLAKVDVLLKGLTGRSFQRTF